MPVTLTWRCPESLDPFSPFFSFFPAGAMQKRFVWIGLFVGSTVGGMVPGLWGAGMFSGWGVLCSLLGGLVGIWAGYKAGRMI